MPPVRSLLGIDAAVDSFPDLPMGGGVVGRVAATLQPMIVNDVRRSDLQATLLKHSLASLVAAPLQ